MSLEGHMRHPGATDQVKASVLCPQLTTLTTGQMNNMGSLSYRRDSHGLLTAVRDAWHH